MRIVFAAALGALLLAGCRDRDPNIPIALVSTPVGAGGRAVPIDFTLRSQDTRSVSVRVFYSLDRRHYVTATAAVRSLSLDGLDASPGGTQHTFLWDAVADLGPGRHEGITFRVRPREGGRRGTSATTGRFRVDNTDIFVRVADLGTPRGRTAGAETAEGGAILAGGASFVAAAEALLPPALALEARADIAAPRDALAGATLLGEDGAEVEPRPVVAGGETTAAVDTVEVYDADGAAGAWTQEALARPRTGHTITRLANGTDALVAGGRDAAGALLATDEVISLAGGFGATDVGGAPAGVARTGHTATLLPDGRVLVVGGTTAASSAVTSTLVYDPVANEYADVGLVLNTARTGHAAALVGGSVVVFGGRDAAGTVLDTAEIIDAATIGAGGTFRAAAGRMTTPRERFAVTALATTEALVIGGSNGAQDLASAERFDLASETFTPTRDPLHVARSGTIAVPFGTGRVLVAGGGTTSVEVYIPRSRIGSRTFDPEATTIPFGRAEHAGAPLADGRALICGGTDGIVEGGALRVLATAEIYDPLAPPGTPRVTRIADMMGARRGHTATLLPDGRVLVAGGFDESGDPLATAEVFDPGTGLFSALPAMPAAVAGHTATLLADGRVLLAGGRDADATGILFDGTTFEAVALRSARRGHTATLLPDGRVFIAGGLASGAPVATTEIFDPASDGSTDGPALPFPLFDHRAVALADGGDVLIAGGRSAVGGAPRADVLRFTPGFPIEALDPLPEPRAGHAMVALGGQEVMVAGGIAGAPPGGAPDLAAPVHASAVVYDAATELASAPVDPDLARARRDPVVIELVDGRFLISGGRAETGAVVAGFEVLER